MVLIIIMISHTQRERLYTIFKFNVPYIIFVKTRKFLNPHLVLGNLKILNVYEMIDF
jgi:hypothetical protein